MYGNISVSKIARLAKAFLRKKVGLTHGKERGTNPERQPDVRTRKQLKKTQQRLEKTQQRLEKTQQRLISVRRREAKKAWSKNNKLAELEALAELETASFQQQDLSKDIPIFFVVGRAKSGTGWLLSTLNRHPEVLCKGEGEFFGRDYGDGQPEAQQAIIRDIRPIRSASLYSALVQSEHLRSWIERSPWTQGDDIEKHVASITRNYIYYIMKNWRMKSRKRIVGDKTPFASPEIIKEIGAVCPEAKVIHIIRDGRDAAISQLHHMWRRATGEEGGRFYMTPQELRKRDRYWRDPEEILGTGEGIFTEEFLREAAEGWKSDVGAARRDGPILLGDNYTEVRYENMLESPEAEFGRLFRFLGARAAPDIVRQCVDATSFKKYSGGRERGQEDSRSPKRKGIAGDWKNVFTERDKFIFKEVAGDLLIELGYEKDKTW